MSFKGRSLTTLARDKVRGVEFRPLLKWKVVPVEDGKVVGGKVEGLLLRVFASESVNELFE